MSEKLRTAIVDGQERDHLTSRHRHFGDLPLFDALTSAVFIQGDVYPAYINDASLSRIRRILAQIWFSPRHTTTLGKVMDSVQRSDGSYKVRVRFRSAMFGIREVKMIVKNGQIMSHTPNRTVGNNFLIRDGRAIKKAMKNNRSFS